MQVTFVTSQGEAQSVCVAPGANLMETAVAAGIEQIGGDCGGTLACATCHVHIPEEWKDRVPAPSEAELDMLDLAVGRDHRSRLSCQINLGSELEGLVVELAESMF